MRLCITKHSRLTLLAALPAALGVTVACGSGEGDAASASRPAGADGDRLSVVSTIYVPEYFARRIGGDRVTVQDLVPPGVEAHDFEPGTADMRALTAADVIVYNGAGFEPWIDRVLSTLDGGGRVEIQTAPEARGPGSSGTRDPHVWLDPVAAVQQAERIRDGLVSADPPGAEGYRERAAALIVELRSLHDRFTSALSGCARTRFVTSHDAFSHLAARYGLEALSITGLSPDAEPAPRELARLADIMLEHSIEYVLVEASAGSRLSDALAREVGAQTLPLHPLETLTPDERSRGETYFTLMDANLRSLATALECPA